MTELTIATIALLVAGLAPFVAIPVLERRGVVDVPNDRSSHSHHALRGGGVAQLVAVVVALVAAMMLIPHPAPQRLWPVLVVAVACGALGLAEDLRGLPILARAAITAAVGGSVVLASALLWSQPWWWAPVGAVAVLGLVNVVNFMDGVNLMSAAHGVVAGGSFVIIGALNDAEWLVAAGLVLGSAFLGFVPWNFRGQLFLGDVGSYLLGGASAIIVVIGAMDGLPIIALAAPFAVYVADTGVTLVGRMVAGERWYEAHRDHTYQRLNRRGWSHSSVTGIVSTASLAAAVLGIAAAESTPAVGAICTAGIVGVVAAYTAARFVIADIDKRDTA